MLTTCLVPFQSRTSCAFSAGRERPSAPSAPLSQSRAAGESETPWKRSCRRYPTSAKRIPYERQAGTSVSMAAYFFRSSRSLSDCRFAISRLSSSEGSSIRFFLSGGGFHRPAIADIYSHRSRRIASVIMSRFPSSAGGPQEGCEPAEQFIVRLHPLFPFGVIYHRAGGNKSEKS